MPILRNAIKKLRKDVGRTERNKLVRSAARSVVKKVRLSRAAEDLKAAFSAVDRAAKKGVYHKKKADRIKSRLSRLMDKAPAEKMVKKTTGKKTTGKRSINKKVGGKVGRKSK